MSLSSEPLRVRAHVTGTAARYTASDGRADELVADDADGVRDLILAQARADAAASGATLELHTSGDHGDHDLLVDPDGDVIVIYDDRTLTRAELRQHAWWTTVRDAATPDAGEQDEHPPVVREPDEDEPDEDEPDEDEPVDAAPDDELPGAADERAEVDDDEPVDAAPDDEFLGAADERAEVDDDEPVDGAPDDEFLGSAEERAEVDDDEPDDEEPDDEFTEIADDGEPTDGTPAEAKPSGIAPVAAGDPGDDDDLDDDDLDGSAFAARTVLTDAEATRPAVPQFFLPGSDDSASAAEPAAGEPQPLPWTPGEVTEISAEVPGPVDVARASRDAEERAEVGSFAGTGAFPVTAGAMASGIETPAAGSRPTFIEPPTEHPAQLTGWRSILASLGIPIGPSRAEIERAEREKLVSRQWAGCRAIAVANGKGGVGKTMTTAVLAAVFARHGGGNVLAWDNNDTRGTLGWRTEQGDYDTTIRDLLPEARRLLEPTASVSDIARFVHHQTVDRYDVLRSNPELLAADQRITTADFDLLARVAARYYRMVIFDSGNDESADRWLRMIDSAHQLVVPTLAAPESAESAALLLDALRRRDEHSHRLADNAIVVVGQSEKSSAAAVEDIAAKFIGHVRGVQVIPFDHALKAGRIRYDALQPRTRDAWMRAAAAVAEGL